MNSCASHHDKRFIALVMLLVWIFMLGANVAHACLMDGFESSLAAPQHHAGSAPTAMPTHAMAAEASERHAPASDDEDHARSHLVHCQAMQAPESVRVSWQPMDKSFDLDAVVATVAPWPRPARPDDRLSTPRLRSDPIYADLPLFIRFRRLTP